MGNLNCSATPAGDRASDRLESKLEMRVKVLFFGILKDVTGLPAEELELPAGRPLRAVFDHYAARFPRIAEMARSIVVARNHEFSDLSAPLSEGDEVAFLPPVSGGAGTPPSIAEAGHYFSLTRTMIDIQRLKTRLITGAE